MAVTFHEFKPDGGHGPSHRLVFDGRQFALEPPDPNLLNSILRNRARDPQTRELVSSSSDPQKWMDLLPLMFRNPYLKAGPVEHV